MKHTQPVKIRVCVLLDTSWKLHSERRMKGEKFFKSINGLVIIKTL